MVAAVRAAPPPQYGRRRVSASRQRFLGDAVRPLPGDGSSDTSPVRRQSVRTTFGLDATVGGYVGAIWDSSARALRHLAKELLQIGRLRMPLVICIVVLHTSHVLS
eukprot:jgi/Chrzof1/12844/Cz07g09120.t1